jgi:hypothetical protein
MKIAFFTIGGQILGPIENELKKQNIELLINTCDDSCDLIYLSTLSATSEAYSAAQSYPDIPVIVYNWDQYKWYKSQTGYKWDMFNELQKQSIEIWTPSKAVNLRVEEFLGLGHKCYIIKSFARLFDYNKEEIKDNRYVFQVVRNYNSDPNFYWAKQACEELNIPLYTNDNHHRSEEEFQKFIAESTLLLCHYDEASTGGLTLIEGHKLGKPVLVCDSPYMGAKDYFGDRAIYFERNNYEDFKNKLKDTFDNPPKYDILECEEFTNQYVIDNMVKNMVDRFNYLKDNNG